MIVDCKRICSGPGNSPMHVCRGPFMLKLRGDQRPQCRISLCYRSPETADAGDFHPGVRPAPFATKQRWRPVVFAPVREHALRETNVGQKDGFKDVSGKATDGRQRLGVDVERLDGVVRRRMLAPRLPTKWLKLSRYASELQTQRTTVMGSIVGGRRDEDSGIDTLYARGDSRGGDLE